MIRRILGMSLVLTLVGSTAAQNPAKPTQNKPGETAKDGPGAEAMVKNILQRMDKNKDGKISKSEAEGRIADNFDRIDTNKDGFLDRAELLVMAKQVIARQAAMGMGMPGRPPFGQPGAGPANPLDFDALDKNADGRLTREELKGTRFEELFDAIDANKDGKIDPKEWTAYHAKTK